MTRSQSRRLEDIARENHPFEGCALLLGSVNEDVVEVTDIIPAENRERSTVTFQIDPKIVYEAYQRADREGKEVVGVFHSHPAPPRPSPIDIQYMQVNQIVWLILSTTTNSFEAYQLHNEDIRPVKILRKNTDT